MFVPVWVYKVLTLYDVDAIDEKNAPVSMKLLNEKWKTYKNTNSQSIEEIAAEWNNELLDLSHNGYLIEILRSMVSSKKFAEIDLTPDRPKFKSITKAMYWLFSVKNPADVTIEESTKLAREVKPGTRFNKWHLYFHRKNYRIIEAARLAKQIGDAHDK